MIHKNQKKKWKNRIRNSNKYKKLRKKWIKLIKKLKNKDRKQSILKF